VRAPRGFVQKKQLLKSFSPSLDDGGLRYAMDLLENARFVEHVMH
jgi:hypothetical protein